MFYSFGKKSLNNIIKYKTRKECFMKGNRISKFIVLLLATALASGCNATKPETSSKQEQSSSLEQSSKQDSSSSNDVSSSSEQKSSSSKSSSKESSKESKSSTTSSSSSKSSSSSSSSQGGGQSQQLGGSPLLDNNYQLQSDPKTCDNHVLEESVTFPASIISKGVKRKTCANCGGYSEEFYYDLDECVFEDKTFMFDGNERTLYIEGVVPYGVTVQYENNKLSQIGSKEATAKFFNENNELIMEKKANINIVENTGIPRVDVVTETGQDPSYKEKEEYTKMSASVSNAGSHNFSEKTGGIRVRGNSTNQSSVNKRAWRLKFDKKVNMLGLNAGPDKKGFKSWVLMADNFDYSYFRNTTAFNFGNDLFNHSGNYTSHFQHVNFYMNGEYRGIYLVAEQQQANMGRISVNEAEENDTSTDVGYIVEIDGLITTGQSKEEYTFTTGNGFSQGGWGWPGGWGGQGGDQINGVTITDKGYAVKTDVYGEEQFPFIKKYVNNVLTIFKNTVKGEKLQVLDENNELIDSPYTTQYETLNAILDIDSIFRTYVLQEFCKNYDCGWGSFYLFVDFAPKGTHKRLTCGAPWDFDLGLGNKSRDGKYTPDGDFITKTGGSMTEFNPWLYLLSQTDFFSEMFNRYYSVFYNSSCFEKAVQYINYETSAFATDFAAEYAKWGGDSGRNSMSTRSYNTHADAVSYLVNWLSSRKSYLDNKYIK